MRCLGERRSSEENISKSWTFWRLFGDCAVDLQLNTEFACRLLDPPATL